MPNKAPEKSILEVNGEEAKLLTGLLAKGRISWDKRSYKVVGTQYGAQGTRNSESSY